MNTQQLIVLIDELNDIAMELLSVGIDLTEKDPETGIKIGAINGRLLNVNMVLTEHLDNQKIEL